MNDARVIKLEDQAGLEVSWGFECPGCKMMHSCRVTPISGKPCWTFNGDVLKPTFSPSVLVRWQRTGSIPQICHSFVRDGQIEFLMDCTHELRGRTVPLPPVED